MVEWTVQRIRWLEDPHSSDYMYKGRHFILCDSQTWCDFSLDRKFVIARINSILDNNGKIIATIGKDVLLESKQLFLRENVINPLIFSDKMKYFHTFFFDKDFVKNYGLRTDEYMDLILHATSKSPNKIEIDEEIYPKRFVTGKMDIQPSGTIPNPSDITNPLIEQTMAGDFYNELVQEINLAYSYQLNRSTLILTRTLLENLVIELLRKKFGMDNLDLFYNKNKNQFLDFYYLIDSLKKKSNEFAPITTGFDSEFFNFLNQFRDNANSKAHALEAYLNKK